MLIKLSKTGGQEACSQNSQGAELACLLGGVRGMLASRENCGGGGYTA
jgi:hypothetical protein